MGEEEGKREGSKGKGKTIEEFKLLYFFPFRYKQTKCVTSS